jgi:hypothetical protein
MAIRQKQSRAANMTFGDAAFVHPIVAEAMDARVCTKTCTANAMGKRVFKLCEM